MVDQKQDDFLSSSKYLDDYFAECDEYLSAIKKNLIILESEEAPPQKVIEEILRRFHTIKGLSGMVGLIEAEKLAHSMEDYFRSLRDKKIDIKKEGIDVIIEGIKLLESVFIEKKAGHSPPSIEVFEEKIKTVLSGEPSKREEESHIPGNLDAELKTKIRKSATKGLSLYFFRFIPSKDLADQGINVNFVREKLNELGEIISSKPNVLQDGGILFEFVLQTNKDENEFAELSNYGISWEKCELKEEPKPQLQPEPDRPKVSKSDEKLISAAIKNIVRVDLTKLDELMRMVGELVITKARFDDSLRRISRYVPEKEMDFLFETHSHMEKQLRNLREGVMRIRMVPIGEVFERMRFVVRDLARESGKKIRLQISGEETEVDKLVVERIMDPMLHLVRNSVSHGIETEDERQKKGKPREGTISLNARTSGDSVVVEIGDDGKGIDVEKVISKALSQGLVTENQLEHQRNLQLLNILCTSGFSTRDDADLASGRGLGMAIVKNIVEELGGSLSLETEPDKGTKFIITLPLTLLIVDALILVSGGHKFAIPQPSLREIIEIEPGKITVLENNELISYRGQPLPLLRLARIFNLPEHYGPIVYGLILGSGSRQIGLMVEQLLTRKEIVVRPITDPLVKVKGIAGATELGDGKPVLILHAQDLIDIAAMKGGAFNA